jgi:hypothetical protein
LPTLHPSNPLTFPMTTLQISPFSLTLEEEDSAILHLRLVLSYFLFILISCHFTYQKKKKKLISCHLVSLIKILYDDSFLKSYESCPVTCSEPSFVSVASTAVLHLCMTLLLCVFFSFPSCLIKLR